MKEKIKKLLFEVSNNSRITTKELGKKINSSQQSAFYLLNNLRAKNLILGDATIIDAIKLGYMNSLIGFNFTRLDDKLKSEVIEGLKKIDEVVGIEESKEGFDLLVECSTKNLAALDKVHIDIIDKYENKLATYFIFPIIKKYVYPRKYLKKEKIVKTKVLFADRTIREINDNEAKVLRELIKEPCKKIIDIAEDINSTTKSVSKAIKELEKKYIIKGYEAIFNHNDLEINRAIIFLRFESGGFKEILKFLDYAKAHVNIIEAIKLIGSSQLAIIVEDVKEIDLIKEIRTKFLIQNYMIFRSAKIHKKGYLPIDS